MDDDFKDVSIIESSAYAHQAPPSRSTDGRTHTARVQAVDIIPGRYAVCFLKHPDAANYSSIAASGISYCIDDELVSSCTELQGIGIGNVACSVLQPQH